MRVACTFALLVVAIALTANADEKKKDSPCSKPPDVAASWKPTKESLEKARKIRAQGSVAIAINEDGDVVDAKVVRASSKEAAELLLDRAKSMKFKSRPGCGVFQTLVNYTLE